ncbi:phage tail tape measure protein [Marivivens donghaensis]|uniref:phage tail tape measure protein n=1 Tax=Marivivens donghaensis TaxID=1699413 RepID=UPI00201F3A83|nr:phage tail tape measure protein [Marivivens donghaensis]MCL7407976.1 phage tail tape measure protein [Marivivens donghaensis]MDN3704045.1 phage tail tape measure protein [Marivivens donghaensis]
MSDFDRLDDLDTQLSSLETSMGEASTMTAAFDAQLRDIRQTLGDTTRDLGNLDAGFSRGLRKAFDGVVFDGMKLSDALSSLGKAMSNTVYNAAMKPVTDHFGGMLAGGLNALVSSIMPYAQGGAFTQGRVMPFAKGGVVTSPTTFPMRGATGLMGEAGPEAIMPLTRSADGRLGVQAQGGGTVHVTMNITTPDVQGFQRSQSQIAAQMSRVMSRGQRNR